MTVAPGKSSRGKRSSLPSLGWSSDFVEVWLPRFDFRLENWFCLAFGVSTGSVFSVSSGQLTWNLVSSVGKTS